MGAQEPWGKLSQGLNVLPDQAGCSSSPPLPAPPTAEKLFFSTPHLITTGGA